MVYSSFYKNHDVTYSGVAAKNMYVGDQILSKTIVVFKSKENISNYEIHSLCKTKSEFLYTLQTQNFFSLQIDDKNCKKESLIKLRVGLCKGRKEYDKKQVLKERTLDKEAKMMMKKFL